MNNPLIFVLVCVSFFFHKIICIQDIEFYLILENIVLTRNKFYNDMFLFLLLKATISYVK